MEILERIWELTCDFFSALTRGVERGITGLFGSSNTRYVRRLQNKVDGINALEAKCQALSNQELADQTRLFRGRLEAGETLDDLLVEAFAVCREAGRRYLSMRHFDVQLIGGMVLHSGAIAEMVTGEGKTLVATLPAYLNALEGKGVHVVTVNDYLARRDMEWMAPLYTGLGLTVGAIQNDMGVDDRQQAYACDITYGTNNEFGFDYLRDNMRPAARGDNRFPKHLQQSQGQLHFAIVDEVDNILVDEARTPLIISGPAHENVRKYADADRIARNLKAGAHFEVNEKDHHVNLTDEGVREAERQAGVETFYTAGNMEWPHLIDNSLKAHHLYKRDVNYVVKDGSVVIVDEFTGRLMEGRQWSDGLHQAVEAKEGVRIKEETQTLATITLQNFFKLYDKLAGMTGTAMTEASEFWKIYKLEVIAIPTNRSLCRVEHPDLIFCTEPEKYEAIVGEIEKLHRWDVLVHKDRSETWGTIQHEDDAAVSFLPKDSREKQTIQKSTLAQILHKGRPILVGTTSIEKSELISGMLERRGVQHQVLNAKHHQREAEIVAQAGRSGAVTIATNMAGRGTDIILGGNPETMAWSVLQDKYPTRLDVPRDEWDALVSQIESREAMKSDGAKVKNLGGLHVIGTERHEARRIDLQLRGRCGRQGDPGSSRFYLSLRDDLMRIFAGPWAEKILKSLGMPEGEAIESRMVTRRIEAAQKKVEERNFEVRKNLLEYDEVMDEQRKRVYSYRQRILEGEDCRRLILHMVEAETRANVTTMAASDYGVDMFAGWASARLHAKIEGRDLRGMTFEEARDHCLEEAQRQAESQIHDAIDENLPDEEDAAEWNWLALSNFANRQWGLNLRDRDLKREGRENIGEFLIEAARKAIDQIDLQEGQVFLAPDFASRSISAWTQQKLQIDLPPTEIAGLDKDAIVARLITLANEAYDQREAEYPVLAALVRFGRRQSDGHLRIDRQALIDWARQRFQAELPEDELKNLQRDELKDRLVALSQEHQRKGRTRQETIVGQLQEVFGSAPGHETAQGLGVGPKLATLLESLGTDLEVRPDAKDWARWPRQTVESRLLALAADRDHPEARRMERSLLLQLVDTSWKDHLLAMDHLRSSIGLVGYAQVDPKVEYKREGMRLFDQMWKTMADRTTDLVFRIEQLDEGFVGSNWVETSATHESAPSTSDIARQQQAAIDASQNSSERIEPFRNVGTHVGRNDPCPCGSGKKYKNCCLRSNGSGKKNLNSSMPTTRP